MENKKLSVCFLLSFAITSLVAEPSAFELQSGATKKELKNLQSTNKNLENLAIDYSARIQMLEQSRDGLQSVVDGQALRIKSLLDTSLQQEAKIKSLQSSLDYHDETIKQQKELIDILQQLVEKNTATIQGLNSKIADLTKLNQDILNELGVDSSAKTKSQTSSTKQANPAKKDSPKVSDKPANESFTKLSHKEIADEARKLYREKKFVESKKRYEHLVKANYRAASSLYMLGEIEYQLGNFQDAIGFYKKSASLDEKASYMPILLWHTAWAFRYSKDMDNYNKFLDSLIRLYPQSDQGKKAKDIRKSKDKQ